ncbi:hypothetical protein, partial [Bradyrhizobium liaoningense]|uniref:hypothetical protein n=1 Tax=Bradyrhizobium liaoningense TaxID=43992 RepID=UPI001BAE10EB
VKPRVQHNPAGIHLNPAGRCPNNRGQLYAGVRKLPFEISTKSGALSFNRLIGRRDTEIGNAGHTVP